MENETQKVRCYQIQRSRSGKEERVKADSLSVLGDPPNLCYEFRKNGRGVERIPASDLDYEPVPVYMDSAEDHAAATELLRKLSIEALGHLSHLE